MKLPSFVLASASVARRRLLQGVGIEPIIRPSNFDESQIKNADPLELVKALAKSKATLVAPEFEDALILGCDSLLVVEGKIYGKPETPEVAIARWLRMRAQQGTLYTGHCLIDRRQQRTLLRSGITQVYFGDITTATIEAYVNSGEPLNCAGAFALEGKGGLLIDRIEGCHSNVIGLSLPLLRAMLTDLGYKISDFWD
ncbi:nucleoside triphosphate pyrophosphatase [Gloeocapsa sp. PCC 73106]|uniref:Maf family protein n=1 Tax=Gloeocapsa sp. PCC 73106 TaxID=102232 RepID=UPI0002ACE268|nr:nucleoside triphosphate pyrophosphatase [Gloeocapsa sp. PCC 73106]ELR97768.1 MAF protein [Gloeocapsa sp. PCC 73106]